MIKIADENMTGFRGEKKVGQIPVRKKFKECQRLQFTAELTKYLPYLSGQNQDSLDQCPMPINTDQNCGIDPNVDQFRSVPINARSGIDRHLEELIGNERHFGSMP